jgi:hypothetical protein
VGASDIGGGWDEQSSVHGGLRRNWSA